MKPSLVLGLVFAIAVFVAPNARGEDWTQNALLPFPFIAHTGIYDGARYVYLVAGTDNEMYYGMGRYDTLTDSYDWDIPQPPTPLAQAGVCRLDDTIYMAGGIWADYVDFAIHAKLQAFNLSTQTWTALDPIPNSLGVTDAAVACDPVRDLVWLVGGMEASLIPRNSVMYYDVAAEEWVVGLAPLPVRQDGLRAVYYRNTLRVVAAGNLYRYSIADDAWELIDTLPFGDCWNLNERLGPVYDIRNGVEVIAGGWCHEPYAFSIWSLPQVFKRHIENGGPLVEIDDPLPFSVAFAGGGFGPGNEFFVVGGLNTAEQLLFLDTNLSYVFDDIPPGDDDVDDDIGDDDLQPDDDIDDDSLDDDFDNLDDEADDDLDNRDDDDDAPDDDAGADDADDSGACCGG